MTRCPIRVVKVGGSLLDLPDLPERLQAWLAAQTPAHHVLIVGGGPLVEQIRQWHAQRPIDETAAHWMCIDCLTVTAHLLHAWLPEIWLEEDDYQLCRRIGDQGATIFGPARWMRFAEPHLAGTKLPASWDTTSDAIAGRLAIALRADEFVLLKSAPPAVGEGWDLSTLAADGYVDRALKLLGDELPPLRFANFREP